MVAVTSLEVVTSVAVVADSGIVVGTSSGTVGGGTGGVVEDGRWPLDGRL